MNRIIFFSTAFAFSCVSFAARAEQPFTENRGQISGHLGVGIDLDDNELNPYGLGIGVRGGYTFDPNIYVGGLFDFFFGDSEEDGALGVSGEASVNAWILQAEVGYDFGVSRSVVLRPKLGLGLTQLSGEVCASAPFVGQVCEDRSDGEFGVSLGLEAPIDLDPVFIAPEMRFHFVDDASALIFAVGIGGAF